MCYKRLGCVTVYSTMYMYIEYDVYVGESSSLDILPLLQMSFCWRVEKVSPDARLQIATTATRNSNNRHAK